MDILDTAQRYVQSNFSVLPIATNGTKQPVGSWKPYQERYATDYELQQLFGTDQPCGIAIACGPISSSLVVVDFDNEAEQIYPQWLAEVQQRLEAC